MEGLGSFEGFESSLAPHQGRIWALAGEAFAGVKANAIEFSGAAMRSIRWSQC